MATHVSGNVSGKVVEDGLTTLTPATHGGDPDGDADSWLLQPFRRMKAEKRSNISSSFFL